MLLTNIQVAGTRGPQCIHTTQEIITAVRPAGEGFETGAVVFDNALAFAGLINSHDHLDFNLFPQLGNKVYGDYTAWAADIHKKNKQAIAAVLKVPQNLRVQWGLYKNLLAGVTTVVNHGEQLPVADAFITLVQQGISLHSPAFEKDLAAKLQRAAADGQTVVMHMGEGTNATALAEIERVIAINAGNKNIIAVHGVAMTAAQAQNFKALVWCPDSNYFLLNQTAAIDQLKEETVILFGADSTLSAHWNIWQHIRRAKATGLLTGEALLNSLTTNAAAVWQLSHTGTIAPQMQADIVIAKNNAAGIWDTNPEDILLVLKKGAVKFFDSTLLPQAEAMEAELRNFSRININGRGKYVYGNLPGLMHTIQQYYPGVQFPVQAYID